MAERRGERGRFGHGFDRGERGGRRGGRQSEEEKWVLVTKLSRLVKENMIHSIEEIYLHSLPVKEHQIMDQLVPGSRMR
jgi:small subunit ribosomal protein S2e